MKLLLNMSNLEQDSNTSVDLDNQRESLELKPKPRSSKLMKLKTMKASEFLPLQSNIRPEYSDDTSDGKCEHGMQKGALLLTDLDFMD